MPETLETLQRVDGWVVHPGADLSGADLRRAELYGAKLSGADLRRAELDEAELSGAKLSGANLSGANLSGANLSGAKLSGAKLSGANLSGANLSGANLSGANLREADLREADLRGAELYGAKLSGATNFLLTLSAMGLAPDPTLPTAILEVLRTQPAQWDQSRWHSACGTAHCVAGWAVQLSGRLGRYLEAQWGTATAATVLLWRDDVPLPSFAFDASREEILAALERLAAAPVAPASTNE